MITKSTLKTCGLLCGAAGVGAAAALLFAPQSGRKTRRDIRKYANHKLDELEDMREDVSTYVDERLVDAKTLMKTCIESAQHNLENGRAAIAASFNGIRGMIDGRIL